MISLRRRSEKKIETWEDFELDVGVEDGVVADEEWDVFSRCAATWTRL